MDSIKGLNEAMAYIEKQLLEEIDYNRVSQLAGCSEYHFRRMFSFLSGMSIGEYIRNRKLTLAVNRLLSSDEKIIDIGLALGYESPDAFTKAFVALHGVTPSEARKHSKTLKMFTPMTFSLQIKGGTEMIYRIVKKNDFVILGVKKRTTLVYNGVNTEMAALAADLGLEKLLSLKALSNTEPSGMLSVSTQFEEGRGEGSQFDQYLGIAREMTPADDSALMRAWDRLEVAATEWAVFTSVGKFPEVLQETWAKIFSEWFPTSGYELAVGPEILWYEGPDMSKADFKTEIWIPVKCTK